MMRRHVWMGLGGWLGGVAVFLLAAGLVRAEEPPDHPRLKRNPARVQVQIQGPMEAAPIRLSDHWIGVECYPVGGALRAQLALPEGQGLVVQQVMPDSPAAKAGLQQYDVLVAAGGKPLGTIKDLVEAVDAAKGKKLSLELLRGGESTKLDVQPTKRPAEARPRPWPGDRGFPRVPGVEHPDWDQIQKWLERVQPGKDGRPPMRFRFFQPGWILPPGAPAQPPLPRNMSVAITKTGDDPARIVVKKGDQKWEVTEDEIDKLPEEIRPHIQRMLGGVPPVAPEQGKPFDFVPDWSMPPGIEVPSPEGLEKRMEEMNRRIEELRKSLDEMRPRLKAPQKKDRPEDQQKV